MKKNCDIFDDTNPSDSSSENNSEIEIEHDCSDYCEDRNPHNCDEITFNISLPDAEWVSIKLTDRMWGKKMFLHLQEDWVDIMNKKISLSVYKIPCVYSFWHARVYKKEKMRFFHV